MIHSNQNTITNTTINMQNAKIQSLFEYNFNAYKRQLWSTASTMTIFIILMKQGFKWVLYQLSKLLQKMIKLINQKLHNQIIMNELQLLKQFPHMMKQYHCLLFSKQ